MQNYKVIQKIYNRTTEHTDLIASMVYSINENPDDIVRYAVRYLTETVENLEFPAKSYAVALMYAYYIEKHFHTSFQNSLDDPDLFDGTDRFFIPYQDSKEIYDRILETLPKPFSPNLKIPQVQKTYDYFLKEFGLQTS